MASERLTKEGDLIIEVEDGPWTFPSTVECLPKEAKSYAEKVCAPWRQYIRTDLAAAREAAAYERAAEKAGEVWAWPQSECSAIPCQEAIRALATDDQTDALEAVKREARAEALREAASLFIEQDVSDEILALIEKGPDHE